MTKKKESKEEISKKTNTKKELLIELVNNSTEDLYVIIGALTYAGLISQYEYEKENYKVLDLKPSLTNEEFTKIIKNFKEA